MILTILGIPASGTVGLITSGQQYFIDG